MATVAVSLEFRCVLGACCAGVAVDDDAVASGSLLKSQLVRRERGRCVITVATREHLTLQLKINKNEYWSLNDAEVIYRKTQYFSQGAVKGESSLISWHSHQGYSATMPPSTKIQHLQNSFSGASA